MRTTVSIDDHLLAEAKERARERGQTLGQLLEDAIRRELSDDRTAEGPPIPVLKGGGGLRPGIDPMSNRSLRAAADEGLSWEHLR